MASLPIPKKNWIGTAGASLIAEPPNYDHLNMLRNSLSQELSMSQTISAQQIDMHSSIEAVRLANTVAAAVEKEFARRAQFTYKDQGWTQMRFRECGGGYLVEWAFKEGEILTEQFVPDLAALADLIPRLVAEKAMR